MTSNHPILESFRTLTLTSQSGKRIHQRVQLPIFVEIAGVEYEASDWGIGGFGLSDGGPSAELDDVVKVRLCFPCAGCDVSMDVTTRVTRVDGRTGCGFQFIDLAAERARVLDYVSERWLSGELTTIEELTQHIGSSARLIAGKAPAKLRPETVKQLKVGGTLLGGLLVLAMGTWYVVSTVLTVSSDYAAVSSAVHQIRASVGGNLIGANLSVGDFVTNGQLLGSLQPVVSSQLRMQTEAQIGVQQTIVDQERAKLRGAKGGFDNFIRTAQSKLDSAIASRLAVEQQVAAEQRAYTRIKQLADDGVLAQTRADLEEVNLASQQHSLATARADESAARQQLDDAKNGRFIADGRSTQMAPSDIASQLSESEAQLERLKTTLKTMADPMPIRSPCDCTVASVEATPGSFIAVGNPIVGLAEQQTDGAQIDALVPSSRIGVIRVGERVKVYLSNHPSAVMAHVAAVNFNPTNSGRIGLPDTLRTVSNYGLVTVTLDSGVEALPAGLPAVVSIPVEISMVLRSIPGLGWI